MNIKNVLITGAAIALTMPLLASAEEISATMQTPPPPKPAAQVIKQRLENIEANRDVRNAKLIPMSTSSRAMKEMPPMPPRMNGSSTPMQRIEGRMENRADMMDMRAEHRASTTEMRVENRMERIEGARPAWIQAMASTSPLRAKLELRVEDRRELMNRKMSTSTQLEMFAKLQTNLIDQLTHTLNSLKDLRAKIADRIDKAEQVGRTMAEARASLVIADAKITAAETAIASVSSYTPPAITAKATFNASTTITLDRPRQIGQGAIDALKTVKEALADVVRAMAHDMGLKTGQDNATSTNPQ